MTVPSIIKACPCGGLPLNKVRNAKARALTYADCCEPFHLGLPAPTAETLMRSRYSAFALGLRQYLQVTWHASTRPPPRELGLLSDDTTLEWIGLKVTYQESIDATHAKVSFIARYRALNRVYRLVETSRFVREIADDDALRWFYVDGDID